MVWRISTERLREKTVGTHPNRWTLSDRLAQSQTYQRDRRNNSLQRNAILVFNVVSGHSPIGHRRFHGNIVCA